MHLLQLKRTIELVWVKASFNLRSEASVNYLSYMWWVIEPLLHMFVYYVVFSFLLSRGGEHYVIFLLTGLIPWLWFSKTVSHTMRSIMDGKELMNQLYIPKIFFPLTFVCQDFIKQFFIFILFLLFLLIYGMPPSLIWFYCIPVIFVQAIFIIACSLIAALVIPFVRDMMFVIPMGLQFMMFCSGIFFSYHDIPIHTQFYFFLNPMAVILAAFRDILLDGVAPDFIQLSYVFGVSLILVCITAYFYRKLEYLIPRAVLN